MIVYYTDQTIRLYAVRIEREDEECAGLYYCVLHQRHQLVRLHIDLHL